MSSEHRFHRAYDTKTAWRVHIRLAFLSMFLTWAQLMYAAPQPESYTAAVAMQGVMEEGVLKGKTDGLFSSQGVNSQRINWAEIHTAASDYVELWAGRGSERFGPVGREVLKQQQQTKLMVFELAHALYMDRDLKVVFRQLAHEMGFSAATLASNLPRSIKASFSSVPGGPPDRKTVASIQQNNSPFNILTVPIAGSHPLQNFARFQTVYVGSTSNPGPWDFITPPMNSIVVNTGDTAWLSSITAASGFLAEGYDFKMVYDTSSASDVATTKAEASFSGWGVAVSGEFSKTESSSTSGSSIYFDYWRKKIYTPDPSNIKEFGVPLSEDFKSELITAYAENKMEDFYQKWGNFFLFGFTRVVRFSTKINMQFTSGTSADQFSAGLSGSYNGWGVSVTAAASYAKDKANQTGRVTFQASRDVLPIGYQDDAALQADAQCVLPKPVTNVSELDNAWIAATTTGLDNCGKGAGIPTATQGDRTHAMLVPLAYLSEFQQVIQDYQKAAAAMPPVQPMPSNLLADLAKVGAEPGAVIGLQKIWGAAKHLQRSAMPYVGLVQRKDLRSVYGQVGDVLQVNLTAQIRSAVKSKECNANGCELLIQALNNVNNMIRDLATGFAADLPFLRDTVDVANGASKLLFDSSRKLTPESEPRKRVDAEAMRIFNLSDTLAKADTVKTVLSFSAYSDIGYNGSTLLSRPYGAEFVTAMYNHTDPPPPPSPPPSPPNTSTNATNATRIPLRSIAADRGLVRTARDSGLINDLNNVSSMIVGPGLVVTLFRKIQVPPAPWWWPTWLWNWEAWWNLLYKSNTYQPRTFFGQGQYSDLSIYLQNWDNAAVAIRVDRLSQMTALRKQAIMAALKDDLNGTQTLLANTTGDTAKR